MQQQKTGLRRDDHANFVRDDDTRAAFEPFFRQKNLYMTEKFVLVVGRKSRKERDPLLDK